MSVIFLVVAAIILTGFSASAQRSTSSQRQEFRDKMKREARDDAGEARRLREERRDLMRKGVSPDQIREAQTQEIDSRRLPDQTGYQDYGSGAEGLSSGFVIYTEPPSAVEPPGAGKKK